MLSLCGDNELAWGAVPNDARLAFDATLDGEPIRCEEPDGETPELSLLLAGAQYMNAELTLICNDATLHVNVGNYLGSDDSCTSSSNGWSLPTETDSAWHDYTGTATLASTIILGPDAMAIPDTGGTKEHGVGTGTLHVELVDRDDASLPPRMLDAVFTLRASAVEILP